MSSEPKLPALRPVDVVQVRGQDGEVYLLLRDMSSIAPHPLAISVAGYYALRHLDGKHSCSDIQAVYRREAGIEIPAEQITRLVAALDEALLLEGPRVEQAYAELEAAYRAEPTRDSRDRYARPRALRAVIEQMLAAGPATDTTDLHGLVAPHLDYGRGFPCYAAAYATLARTPPADRYVILGTNHGGRATAPVATAKPFQTPLGIAPVDEAFIQRLEARLGTSLRRHEHDHANEHSVELQVHFLQVILGRRPFTIVPVLCPSPCAPAGCAGRDGAEDGLAAFAAALGAAVAEADGRTVVIAAADLSHVGQRFGDADPTTPERLAEIERIDRELLALLEADAAEGFVTRLRTGGNPTRVCSGGCLYVLRAALAGRRCRVLRYHQAVNTKLDTHVTCAAAVIE